MKIVWAMVLVGIVMASCMVGGESREAVCRHKAVMAALVYAEHYPVRIAYGRTHDGGYHCQAQAYIGGQWCFLRVIPQQIDVITDEQDDWYTVSRYFELDEFFDRMYVMKNY